MGDNLANTGKYAFKYGSILGGALLVFNLALYFMDMHYSRDTTINIVNVVLMFGATFWAISSFKKENNGFLTIREALKIGAGTALIAAFISIIYTIFLSKILDTEFATKVAELQKVADEAANYMTPEEIQVRYKGTKEHFWMSFPLIVILYVVFGFVFGLVSGFFLKKQKPIN